MSADQLERDLRHHEHQRRSAIRQALDSLVIQGILTRAEADERYERAVKPASSESGPQATLGEAEGKRARLDE